MPFFSKVFKSKDASPPPARAKAANGPGAGGLSLQANKFGEDPWACKEVAAEDVQTLLHLCTQEMKSKALHMPFLLLPFRPVSDPNAARHFIRNYLNAAVASTAASRDPDQSLLTELRLLEPMVLGSILKWCWSRLKGGVVSWETYELFTVGEKESHMAKHAFDTFIPLSVDSEARKNIIFDFFDLLAAIAANGKANGLSGRKLSRLAGWWAFEPTEQEKGFDRSYKAWDRAANACTHLFFAYLRSLSGDAADGVSGISKLPRSLESLLAQSEYPPEPALLLQTRAPRVSMLVSVVSPTPFALLRRAKDFEYRADDYVLQRFSDYDDPVSALTPECRRVLEAIAATNRSNGHVVAPTEVPGSPDNSWSRFEDLGFSSLLDEDAPAQDAGAPRYSRAAEGLRATPASPNQDAGSRPKTPSWADFMSDGFSSEEPVIQPERLILPPSQVLPPLSPSGTSRTAAGNGTADYNLEPGQLANISQVDMDETFWWVWITSLAAEESPARKAVFGRCALIETVIPGGRWLVLEEQMKGSAPPPDTGSYVPEKKGRFTSLTRGKTRSKTTAKKPSERGLASALSNDSSRTSVAAAQQAKVQAAAAALVQEQKDREAVKLSPRRSRTDPDAAAKTTSVMTLQPVIIKEAAPAMQWASKFDREAIRQKYLGDASFGKGESREDLTAVANGSAVAKPAAPRSISPASPSAAAAAAAAKPATAERELPRTPEPKAQELSVAPLPAPAPASAPAPPPKAAVIPTTPPVVVSQPPAESKPIAPPAPAPPVVESKAPEPLAQPEELDADSELSDEEVEGAKTPSGAAALVTRTNRAPTVDAAVKAFEAKAASSSSTPEKSSSSKLKKQSSSRGFKKLFSRNKTDKPTVSGPLGVTQTSITSRPAGTGMKAGAPESPYVDAADAQKVQSDFSQYNTAAADEPAQARDLSSGLSASLLTANANEPTSTGAVKQGSSTNPVELPSTHDTTGATDIPNHPVDHHTDADDEHEHESAVPPALHELDGTSSLAATSAAPAALVSPLDPDEASTHFPESHDGGEPRFSVENDRDHDTALSHETSISSSTDRWAQIRKNAADRRRSEEASAGQVSGRPSQSGRTVGTERSEDGETSGEETIESRVARIKARVAELTGGLESSRSETSPGALESDAREAE